MAEYYLPQRVRVSAPAKVLLFGEHAVVYGCPSVAAALTDLRLAVAIERVEELDASVEFVFDGIHDKQLPADDGLAAPAVALRRRFGFSSLRRVIGDVASDDGFLPAPEADMLARIDELVRDDHADNAKALRPAIFLSCALLHSSPLMTGQIGGLRVQTSSENFPIGAGLGSSAAFSVALAGALERFRVQPISPREANATLELVNRFAFASETLLHGSPSGVDNTVSAFGGALLFRKLPTPSFSRIACDLTHFRFLIVNTHVPRSTKELVAGVRERYDADATVTQARFDAIEALVTNFTEMSARGELTEEVLGAQFVQNHAILNQLGVGHARIEDVVRICAPHGISTKLTGAGGGGCTVSLVPSSVSDTELDEVVKELEAQGFECFRSAVGGVGFTIDSTLH